ncbi:hypothetical protein IG193_05770 [Infirmifilum lucidum]|uniref:Uncharacterized protein n=1 Tax=Infirmifilum lucidum TaxID=2776706 RepID=A0A7L9FH80_9CREN|nr:hypothetical protein [Infirmifilum lucidum]QOJ78276.1 hypothetical protein IG193_05770 [Infirmifilum lucidum]
MQGRVTGVEMLSYADVARLRIEGESGVFEVEIPLKVLKEVGINPLPGSGIEIGVEKSASDFEGWDIVLSGEVYLRQESQNRLYISAGGLQIVIPISVATGFNNVGDKVYVKLRFQRGRD